MQKIIHFFRTETVLSIAWLLAICSAFLVHPSAVYIDYIDFRTLGILWSMMIIMEGLSRNGFFDLVGEKLLSRTKTKFSLISILVFLCFFFSMLITNDVALLTFVPFTMYILKTGNQLSLLIPVVVFQTLAANLGSMLTPIGNPQNLYLYGLSGMSIGAFVLRMLPYAALTAVLLILSVFLLIKWDEKNETATSSNGPSVKEASLGSKKQILAYAILFVLALSVVIRITPYTVLVAIVLCTVFFLDRKVLLSVDYALLFTFIGFFIFTGNIGRMPSISSALTALVDGQEVVVGILISQVISNVPAALLLSGFTDQLSNLILGVNLGGLGTLIASMASLISFKFVAHSYNEKKGAFFLFFTIMNLLYLIALLGLWFFLEV